MIFIFSISAISSSGIVDRKGNSNSPSLNVETNQTHIKVDQNYGKMPLYFIPNKGQMNKQVAFYIQGKDKTLYFTPEGVTYSLNATDSQGLVLKNPPLDPGKTFDKKDVSKISKRWVVKHEFIGANKNIKPECLEQSETTISYFKGKKEDWKTGLQGASKIIYRNLWPDIDLVYYGTVNRIKYEFIVHPGADPSKIKLAYRGAKNVKTNPNGQLEIQTPAGSFYDDTPVAWQDIDGKRQSVTMNYALDNETQKKKTGDSSVVTYGFDIGKYNPKQTLILDPAVIVYCGYIGGYGRDASLEITVDALGCAYVTGFTDSTQASFPEMVGPDLSYNGNIDIFVAKVKEDGTGLIYCGYIGGVGDEYGMGLAVDTYGCTYLNGYTNSSESQGFPVIRGPDLTFNGGGYDGFVTKLNSAGTGLVYCGYIGGSDSDWLYELAVDTSGNAYVTGFTYSNQATFPVTVGPDLTHNNDYDIVVAKVNPNGTGLVYCGYIGGAKNEVGMAIAVDTQGCAYVTGYTRSTKEDGFPVKGPLDTTYNGEYYDAYVAKVNSSGSELVYCGYIGGSDFDYGVDIAVDALGCAYIAGHTYSDQTTFPVAGGPYLIHSGNLDAFIAKVNADGVGLDFCGYIGGAGRDGSEGIAIDASGFAYIVGVTDSTEATFPVIGGPKLINSGGKYDVFVAKVNPDGIGLVYSGYIGGSGYEDSSGIAVDASDCAYITGETDSDQTTFPVIVGPDLTYNTGGDAFIAKISTNCHEVNFIAGAGGTLSGVLSQIILNGNNSTGVTAVPNTGYSFVNWTGTNGFATTTVNPLTVTNVTSDMTISANFVYYNPAGWVPVEGLQNNMIVYGKAYNGNNSAASGDWIGAFGPGGISDCRGTTTLQSNGNFYITIGSTETSNETITFKLWPLPSGPAINSSESILFIDNGSYKGLPLHFGSKTQSFSLVNGWNWISFNTLPSDTSFNSVFGSISGSVEQVKSQTKAAIYTGGNWIGDLTDMSGITNSIMYKVKTNQTCAFTVTGSTISFNTPISLITGWNWKAYLPTLSQPVSDAVNSIITPVNQVKSQTQSVIKIGSTLFGDLIQMEPNKGYLILMDQAGVFYYPHGVSVFPDQKSKSEEDKNAQPVSWPIIKGNQYNMVITGKAYLQGKIINTTGYYLASVGPNGNNDGRSLSRVKADGSYFTTVLGNTNGESIKFKLINSTTGKIYDVAPSLVFRPDDLKTAFSFKAISLNVIGPAKNTIGVTGKTLTITWVSYEMNNVKIELLKNGKLHSVIAPSVPANTGSYKWKIPHQIPLGTDYQVKISCVDPGLTATDTGKNYFTITGSGTSGI